jgi:hypothetical protein
MESAFLLTDVWVPLIGIKIPSPVCNRFIGNNRFRLKAGNKRIQEIANRAPVARKILGNMPKEKRYG